jgi:hypothetical protein
MEHLSWRFLWWRTVRLAAGSSRTRNNASLTPKSRTVAQSGGDWPRLELWAGGGKQVAVKGTQCFL